MHTCAHTYRTYHANFIIPLTRAYTLFPIQVGDLNFSAKSKENKHLVDLKKYIDVWTILNPKEHGQYQYA